MIYKNFIFFLLFTLKISAIDVSKCCDFDFEETKNFISNFVRAGDLVFDVGAHEGKKTQVYLSLGARVVCFEPQPECIAQLKVKFGNCDMVTIEEIGLSDREGILEFFQCTQANTISTFSKEYTQKGRFVEHNYQWDKKISARLSTLDKMINKYGIPRFCKIDVENFEYEVLSGLSTPINFISFESNTEWIDSTKKCVRLLEKLGYKKFNFAVGERDWLLFGEWLPAEVFLNELVSVSKNSCWDVVWGLWGDVYAQY
jgi:FkbM family methyltransferase